MTSKADLENLVLMDLGMDGIEPVRLSDVADIEYIDNWRFLFQSEWKSGGNAFD